MQKSVLFFPRLFPTFLFMKRFLSPILFAFLGLGFQIGLSQGKGDSIFHNISQQKFEGEILNDSLNNNDEVKIRTTSGIFGFNIKSLGEIVWEGVTNAEDYYAKGNAFKKQADDLIARGQAEKNDQLFLDARAPYRQMMAQFQNIKPQTDRFRELEGKFIYKTATEEIRRAQDIIDKVTAADHFNRASRAWQEAMSVSDPAGMPGVIGTIDGAVENFKKALELYRIINEKAQIANPNLNEILYEEETDSCKNHIADSSPVKSWIHRTYPLFDAPDLRELQDFQLQQLLENLAISRGDYLKMLELSSVQPPQWKPIDNAMAERVEAAEAVVDYRNSVREEFNGIRTKFAEIPLLVESKKYDEAESILKSIGLSLAEVDTERINNQQRTDLAEARERQKCILLQTTYEHELFDIRNLMRVGGFGKFDEWSAALTDIRSTLVELETVEPPCDQQPWVTNIASSLSNDLNTLTNRMAEDNWTYKTDSAEWLPPTDEVLLTEFDGHVAATNWAMAEQYHNLLMQHYPTTEVHSNAHDRIATYLVNHGKLHYDAAMGIKNNPQQKKATFQKAIDKYDLVLNNYAGTPSKSDAFKGKAMAWGMKNLILLASVAAAILLLLLILFLMSRTAKSIEKKQRAKIHKLEQNTRLSPQKKIAAYEKIVKKLEGLRKKRKITKAGNHLLGHALINQGDLHLGLKQKEKGDRCIRKAQDVVPIEAERVLTPYAKYFLRENDTSEEAVEVYSDYLELPEGEINAKIEERIHALFADEEDEDDIYEEADDVEEAIEEAEEAIEEAVEEVAEEIEEVATRTTKTSVPKTSTGKPKTVIRRKSTVRKIQIKKKP